ncbi:MAG: EamA family transporter [Ignavibacteriaceae bacterium]
MSWFLLAFISALFSAAAAISQKKILFKIEALEFSLLLSILNIIFLLPLFFFLNYENIFWDKLLVLYIKTILEAFAFWNVMLAIKNFEISKALPLLALTPGLVAVSAFIFIGDSLTLYEVFGILLLILGTYILETKSRQDLLDPFKIFMSSKKHHYVITALLLFTVTALIDRLLLHKYDMEPESFLVFQNLFIAVNFIFIFLLSKKSFNNTINFIKKDLIILLVLISVFTIIYRYTQIEAVKIAPVALVLAVKRISIFFAAVIGGRLFKEHNMWVRAAATAIIIIGTLLISVY